MFISTMRTLIFSTGMMLLMFGFNLFSQDQLRDLKGDPQQTLASFEEGDYRSALAGYRKMLEDDPGNALNSYYAGRCLVELNQDLDQAIELLFGASTRGVPHDVDYYLGLAYHRNYNFVDAQKYYARFEMEASRQELKDFNIKHLLGTCRSAMEITATYNPFEVMNVTFIDLFDSLQFSQVKMKGGQLQRKADELFRENESRDGLTALMFMPQNSVRGDYIYYSGYARSGKAGTQLFRIKKVAGRSWGDPEEIQMLNTDGDEVMPYFDPIENDLYFASDGRWGIGGFDLYRSHYDSDRDQWSEPMNLGFPINSVMDEYLLLPGSDLGMVMFFTTRQGTDSTVTVYRVHLAEPKQKTAPNDFTMLKDIASLGGVADDILAEMEALREPASPRASGNTKAVVQDRDDRGVSEITPVVILPEPKAQASYQVTLAEALGHQALSDSLKDLASEARVRVRASEDPNDRWVWQKQIMLWEKKARDEEELADELYARVEAERAIQPRTPAVNTPESIQVDRVVDGLTVYRYTTGEAETEGSAGSAQATDNNPSMDPSPAKVQTQPVKYGGRVINKFEVLNQSPYNEGNPIPMDETMPLGSYYRIQIGVFSAAVEQGVFGGFNPVTGERDLERGLVKYYAGKFTRYDDASTALSVIRSSGYEDAFIVAWYNSIPVSTQKAKQLE